MKFLAVIPARGNSKGIPKKNIKLLAGKPLIQYTLDVANKIFETKDICISTDDKEIIEIVEILGYKVPFTRPANLATDSATTQEVLLHAISHYRAMGLNYDAIVLLQPTSPLRIVNDISNALKLYNNDIDMVVSVKETDANPYYVLYEENKSGFLKKSKLGNFTRRQDCPTVWELNGAVYVINVQSLLSGPISEFAHIIKSPMSRFNSIDIDNEIDWKLAELIIISNN